MNYSARSIPNYLMILNCLRIYLSSGGEAKTFVINNWEVLEHR